MILKRLINILNERLTGVPLDHLNNKLFKEVVVLLKEHIQNYDFLLNSIADTFKVPHSEKLFFGGKTNMLNEPEFHDIDKVRGLLNLIERENDFYDIIRNNPTGIHVKIGRENDISVMEDCSFITATYSIVTTTTINCCSRPLNGVYAISLMQLLTKDLSTVLTNLYGIK